MKIRLDKESKKIVISYKGKKKKVSDAQMRRDLACDMEDCRRKIKALNDRFNQTWAEPTTPEVLARRDSLREEIKRLEERNHSLRAEYLKLKDSNREVKKEVIHVIGMSVIIFTVVGFEKLGQTVLTGQGNGVTNKILDAFVKWK